MKKLHDPLSRYRSDSRFFHILESISAGDMFVGFLLSGRNTRKMYQIAHRRAQERYLNKKEISKLKEYGFVREITHGGTVSFFITPEGKHALRELYLHTNAQALKPNTWNGIWHVVSYDFPEVDRSARNSLRHILEKAHFKQVQKSVWVSPYNAKQLENILSRNPIVKRCTVYITATRISNETELKKYFKVEKESEK